MHVRQNKCTKLKVPCGQWKYCARYLQSITFFGKTLIFDIMVDLKNIRVTIAIIYIYQPCWLKKVSKSFAYKTMHKRLIENLNIHNFADVILITSILNAIMILLNGVKIVLTVLSGQDQSVGDNSRVYILQHLIPDRKSSLIFNLLIMRSSVDVQVRVHLPQACH